MHMVPMIRNILGGFLFSGDDIYKKVRVLSGGERTRLAVARMLLRPSNTLLLDEPTNHLDLDSKEVLLDALVDYGGTLVFVSHDRYFVERLATKVIEVGNGGVLVYPGTYKEFLWHKEHPDVPQAQPGTSRDTTAGTRPAASGPSARQQQPATATRAGRQEAPSPAPALRHSPQPSRDEQQTSRRRIAPEIARRAGAQGAGRTRSKHGSPKPKPRSANSRRACPPRASTTTAPLHRRRPTSTRRSCGRSAS